MRTAEFEFKHDREILKDRPLNVHTQDATDKIHDLSMGYQRITQHGV